MASVSGNLLRTLGANYSLVHFSPGNLLSRHGLHEVAKVELENLIKLAPNLANPFYGSIDTSHHLGLNEMSMKAYQGFQSVNHQEEAQNPVETTISPPECQWEHNIRKGKSARLTKGSPEGRTIQFRNHWQQEYGTCRNTDCAS